MKIKKILCCVFGTMSLFIGLILLVSGDPVTIMAGISFILIAFIIYPIFNDFCKIFNKRFSIGRRIGLGIGTFLIAPYLFSSDEVVYGHIASYVIAVVSFWIVMFVTDKKQFLDKDSRILEKETEKTDIFSKINNARIRKNNARIMAIIEYENEVKANFQDLNIMTIHAIAKMLSETKTKQQSIFSNNMPEINMSKLVMEFCKDVQKLEDEYEVNDLYTNDYYISKIKQNCLELEKYIKNQIRSSFSLQNQNRYIEYYNKYLNIFMNTMNSFSNIKLYRTISVYGDDFDMDSEFDTNTINVAFREPFLYLIDALSTATCIAKMIFVERKVKQLNEDNDFYKIVSNMAREIKDVDIIIEKSRPIYDEFYKSTLGFINDELSYSIAIANLVNRINQRQLSKKEEDILNIGNEQVDDLNTYDNSMRKWIANVAKKNKDIEINKYIVFRTMKIVNIDNFYVLINSLEKIDEYIELYNYCVEHNNKLLDKDRYLKGDFTKEKTELSGRYTLNNIVTGTQFELYLVNLFKDLGYKVKHNGKSGDQGADIILKKGNYVYAVQAKYYTGKLGNTPVQEITGALKFYNANQGVVVTNSEFTIGAEELAKANDIILIDGKDLKKLVDYAMDYDEDNDEDVLKNFII